MSPRLSVLFFCTVAMLRAGAPLDDAIALYHEKRFAEAEEALRRLVTANPPDAEAFHYLGLTLSKRNTPDALDQAIPWLEKAVALRPEDSDIVGDYGGICLLLASQHRSLSYATKGRAAMEKAIALNPDDLEAREGLMQFFQEAPWPIGSSAKAREQAAEINRRDPRRGLLAFVYLKQSAKDYDGLFALCDETLAREPDNYVALYEYGRAASQTGENVPRAVARLRHALTLPAPAGSPGHTGVQYRLGTLYEKQGDIAAARAAYQQAVALDAGNRPAADALARLK